MKWFELSDRQYQKIEAQFAHLENDEAREAAVAEAVAEAERVGEQAARAEFERQLEVDRSLDAACAEIEKALVGQSVVFRNTHPSRYFTVNGSFTIRVSDHPQKKVSASRWDEDGPLVSVGGYDHEEGARHDSADFSFPELSIEQLLCAVAARLQEEE